MNIRDEMLLQKSSLSRDLQYQYEQNEMRKNSFHEPDVMANMQGSAMSSDSKNTDGEAVITITSPAAHLAYISVEVPAVTPSVPLS